MKKTCNDDADYNLLLTFFFNKTSSFYYQYMLSVCT